MSDKEQELERAIGFISSMIKKTHADFDHWVKEKKRLQEELDRIRDEDRRGME